MISSILGFCKELLISIRMLSKWIFRKKRTIKEEIEVSEKVDELLNKLLIETGSDRCLLFQFHNGNYFYSGAHISKMTNTNEVVLNGISQEQLNSQDLMTGPYKELVNDLFSNKVCEYYDTSEIKDFNTKMFFDKRGTKSFAATIIMTPDKKSIGFIGMEFVKTNKVPNIYSKTLLLEASKSVYQLLLDGKLRKGDKSLLNE